MKENKIFQQPEQKEVNEEYEIVCGRIQKCCGSNPECAGDFAAHPTGKIIFRRCDC
ncbi:hypothetical protein [Bacillus cereus group sp. N24]|uniref:hypothetical protein n=1 Tax=Bacillus cereus group sp. N24 TaxID=2794592 RepID=UPI0018F454E5|nr:hypothetical protein [Bacillus cereus group sp. N24]MBJ7950105.1 hypothetical protein [Bacillus cereus group sp. N24]